MSELVSLHDFNLARRREARAQGSFNPPNGIACPQCGQELCDGKLGRVLTSYPTIHQIEVFCGCGYKGYRNT